MGENGTPITQETGYYVLVGLSLTTQVVGCLPCHAVLSPWIAFSNSSVRLCYRFSYDLFMHRDVDRRDAI